MLEVESEETSEKNEAKSNELTSTPSLPRLNLPRLPAELHTQIFRQLEKNEDLLSVQLVSKSVRELSTSILYHSFNVSRILHLKQLLRMARDPVFISSIRVVTVHLLSGDFWYHRESDWTQQAPLLALSVSLLTNLHTLDIAPSPFIHLDISVQLAIVSHPTLRTLKFDSWSLVKNDFHPLALARPVGSPPLVLDRISLSRTSFGSSEDLMANPNVLIEDLLEFIDRYDVRVGTFDLQTPSPKDNRRDLDELFFDDFTNHFFILPDLHTLRLQSHFPPDSVNSGPWLSSFLGRHRSLKKIEFYSGKGQARVDLPFLGLAAVKGLEVFGGKSELMGFLDGWYITCVGLDVRWTEEESNSDGRWEVVGLRVEDKPSLPDMDVSYVEDRYIIKACDIRSVLSYFPRLERVELVGIFSVEKISHRSSTLHFNDYLAFVNSFPSHPYLKHLSFPGPSSLLFERRFCSHQLDAMGIALSNYPGSTPSTVLEDEERWMRRKRLRKLNPPSPCWRGVDAVDRVPKRMVDLWISLARKMPRLETLVWNVWSDGEDPAGSLRWKVVRGEGGEVRLVDDGTRFRDLKESHTGSSDLLDDIVYGE